MRRLDALPVIEGRRLLGFALLLLARALVAEGGTALPHGWEARDIGPVAEPGRTEVLGPGAFRVFGRNWLANEADGIHFCFTRRRGEFAMVARIGRGSDALGLGGIMIRAGLEADAPYVAVGRSTYNRPYNGGKDEAWSRIRPVRGAWLAGEARALPDGDLWVKLVRAGRNVVGYWSADGKLWNLWGTGGGPNGGGPLGTESQPLPDEVLAGVFAAGKHDANALQSVEVDGVGFEEYRPTYATSWIGNSYGGQYWFGHVQMQIKAMCVEPGDNPVLRVTGLNEALDSSVFDLDGNLLEMYQLENGGSHVIASDGVRHFEGTPGSDRRTIRLEQFGAYGRPPFGSSKPRAKRSLEGLYITGAAARDGLLFVADALGERVVVCDAETMAELRSFSVPRPGAVALDQQGCLWVVRRQGTEPFDPEKDPWNVTFADPKAPAGILHFRPDGTPLPRDTITFSGIADPVLPRQIAVNPKTGALYVCDTGPGQCVWIFDARGRQIGRLGGLRGVYGDETPGRVSDSRLYWPRAIAIDQDGNVYVAMCPRAGWVGGNLLRKYSPGGEVLWERYGLEFQECADADPGTDGRDVFTQQHRYSMDYSKNAGKEATLAALTFDPFAYPDDYRNTLNGGAVNATSVRRIGGRRIMFLHEWARNGENIYRFQRGSEIAIPCGRISNNGFWMDANGNGRPDEDERAPGVDEKGICWTVDSRGDIWNAAGTSVRCWRCRGLNAHGVPVYDRKPTEVYPVPGPYTDVHYVVYDPKTDVLFVGGYTAGLPKDPIEHGGALGQWLSCFEGVRARGDLSKLRWARRIPYFFGREGLGHETNCFFCAAYAGDERGGYLFLGGLSERGVKKCSIWALDASDGRHVETFLPGPEAGGYCAWFDFNNAINAFRRSDGEYLIFAEDDGAQKVVMYRWRP